jgi:hypothetical protein
VDYGQALARLRSIRSVTIPGGDDFADLTVDFDGGDTVTIEAYGFFIWLSPEMLQAAAEWVGAQAKE